MIVRDPFLGNEWFALYLDFNDWWVGYYRGEHYHFICPLPTVVLRFPRAARC